MQIFIRRQDHHPVKFVPALLQSHFVEAGLTVQPFGQGRIGRVDADVVKRGGVGESRGCSVSRMIITDDQR